MKGICLVMLVTLVFGTCFAKVAAGRQFILHPIGQVKKVYGRTTIVLDKKVQPGLLGLEKAPG